MRQFADNSCESDETLTVFDTERILLKFNQKTKLSQQKSEVSI